ncbi:unnamed protein product [Thlaspi arvense]|uniref:Uncharacterized protein n=1 Tax=Thlaspi arvense TaxID=13288 RepID=A0AAU9SGG2_THLAR|nr:unnamed protein product [Thlaspi arvense]
MRGGEIQKARTDKREYRRIVLKNSLEVLLISDPETDKCAASMNVSVGSFSDPEGLDGLAHFLEHMLFFASEKYPEEDSYSKYIAEHGGSTNAYTSSEDTNYHFDVNTDSFDEALDRFAQFFIKPLMSADATMREIKAVDSENQQNLLSDSRRLRQLQKHLSRDDHPYHKFSTGNMDTLLVRPEANGIDTRSELLKFYDEYYSANIMHLVVYGKENLDKIQATVEKIFQEIRNTNKSIPRFLGQPCTLDHLQVLVKVVPIKQGHELNVTWPVTTTIHHYEEAPCCYVGQQVCMLANQTGIWSTLSSMFGLTLLMPAMMEHMQQVVGLLYKFIKLLQQSGVSQWIFDELAAICEAEFHYQSKTDPISDAEEHSSSMTIYPIKHWLVGSSLPSKFNPALVQKVLDELSPNNVRIFWKSNKFEGKTDKVEPWYNTAYSLEKITKLTIQEWEQSAPDANLLLPTPNVFIPTDLSLKEIKDKEVFPVLLRETSFSRLWYKPDTKFFKPKAYVVMDFNCPLAVTSPDAVVLSNIFVGLLVDYLNEYAYYAQAAGLYYGISLSDNGFQLTLVGFNHKLRILLEAIIQKIATFQVKPDRFLVIKEKKTKAYQNCKFRQPYRQATSYCSLVLQDQTWPWTEELDALSHMEAQDLANFVPMLLSRTFVECYVAGNVDKEEAESMVKHIEDVLFNDPKPICRPLFPSQLPTNRIAELGTGMRYFYHQQGSNPKDENSALVHYIQVHQDEFSMNVKLELFCLIAKQATFYQLRTVEQLGYITSLSRRIDYGVNGLQFIIQSSVKGPAHIDSRVESLLKDLESKLYKMSDEEFKSNVTALIDMKLEKHKNLSEESWFYWSAIQKGTLKFNRIDAEVDALRELKKDELIAFFDEYIKVGAPKKRSLSICVYGSQHLNEMASDKDQVVSPFVEIQDIVGFRKSQPLYGSLKGCSQLKLNRTAMALGKENATADEGEEILKPGADEKEYRRIVLENSLEVLLISDPETDKCAASMNVSVGSFSDPEGMDGLAHFLEHMLFFASDKYPEEDSYSKYIAEHGGSTNAHTSSEDTNYHFDVNTDSFDEALDSMEEAQMLIHPVKTQTTISMSTQTLLTRLWTENQKNLLSDSCRLRQLQKHLSRDDHPYHKFNTGNMDTLLVRPEANGIDTRSELLKFYDEYYSANIMHLVLVKAVPIMQGHELNVSWPVTTSIHHYEEAPSYNVRHLINHVAGGSWATELYAGEADWNMEYSFFNVWIKLTDAGHEHMQQVVGLLFRYIKRLQQSGVSQWIFDELAAICEAEFHYQSKTISDVVEHSSSMTIYPIKHWLVRSSLPSKFNPAIVQKVLDELSPINVRIFWESNTFEGKTDEVEPWYNTAYSLEKITRFTIQEWVQSALDEVFPVLLRETPFSRLWYKPDTKFLKPKACVIMEFNCPLAATSPDAQVLSEMFVWLLADYLNEHAYYALAAGLHYGLNLSGSGFELAFVGFNHKLRILLEAFIQRIATFQVKPDRFLVIKETVTRGYKNFNCDKPYEQAMSYCSVVLRDQAWHWKENLDALSHMEAGDLENFVPMMLSRTFVKCYITGNVDKEEAESMVKHIEDVLFNDPKPISRPLSPSQLPAKRIAELGKGTRYFYHQQGLNPKDENSALVHYIQVHQDEFSMNVKLELFCLIAKQATFYQLRTVEQLGYITSLSRRIDSGVYGVQFIIQSSVKGPAHIDSRVESLVKDLESKLYKMSDQEFKSNVTALIDVKLEKHKTLTEENSYYWGEIQDGTLKFNRIDAEVAALRELKKEELIDFFDEYIKVGAPKKRSLSICVYGSQHLNEMASDKDKVVSPLVEIQDIVGFRKSQPLYGSLRGCSQLKLEPRLSEEDSTTKTEMAVGKKNAAETADEGEEILKARTDKREYRRIVLKNSLEVLLISDPETDKCAASMNVSVGSFSNPEGLDGLAHFLEHMLFYASEKYPEEDSYSKYIAEHGGSTNAYTSSEDTNYHFDINTDSFDEALDRFAQFFIKPLMSADATMREIKAVDSENQKNLLSDSWRLRQLQKHLSREDHPYHKFSTGNMDTLHVRPEARGIDTRSELIKFYDQHYSANIMHLVVYGKENLDKTQGLVEELFQEIRNTNKCIPRFPGQPCTPDHLQVLVKVVPIRQGHALTVSWPVTPSILHYQEAPCRYLSHLIGHEGKGRWATGLSAGEAGQNMEYSFFNVSIDLTDDGHEHMEDVLGLLFRHIKLLQQSGVYQWIFDEISAVSESNFHYQSKTHPISYATGISPKMKTYPTKHWLVRSSLPSKFNPALVQKVLDELSPSNVRIFWESNKFEGKTDKVEPWYNTAYSLEKITKLTIQEWEQSAPDANLLLPTPNVFIPTDLSLKEIKDKEVFPVLLRETSFSRLWYKPDTKFFKPKAYVKMDFNCPLAVTSPDAVVLSNIFVPLLVDYLNEYAYYAQTAGLYYGISLSDNGFQLTLVGFNHKLRILLEAIIQKIATFQVKPDRFLVIKEINTKAYQNCKFRQPYRQATSYCSLVLQDQTWPWTEKLDALSHMEAGDLENFVPMLLSRTFVECYVAGNVDKEEAESMVKHIEDVLFNDPKPISRPLFPSQLPTKRIAELGAGTRYFYHQEGSNPKDENSALVHYIQVHQDEFSMNVKLELFCLIAKQATFYQLRTVEQLGYITSLSRRIDSGVYGVQFIIQSSVKGPAHIDSRVESLLKDLESKLYKMSDQEFKSNVTALIDMKLEKHKNLSEESWFYWGEIKNGTLKFNRIDAEVAALRELKKEELIDFFGKYIKMYAPKKRSLSICVYGSQHMNEMASDKDKVVSPFVEIQDIVGFRKSQPLYGSLKGCSQLKLNFIIENTFKTPSSLCYLRIILVKAVPIKQSHKLRIFWPITPSIHHNEEAPCRYLSHLIGHEGEGSLFHALKTLGWATKLFASEAEWTIEYSFFKVSIDLSDTGHEHMQQVVGLLFRYIKLSQQSGVSQWIFDELSSICETKFHYQDKTQPISYAVDIASNMQIYPTKDWLVGSSLLSKFNPAIVKKVLDELCPTNVRIFWESKKFEGQTDKVEPWYNTAYSLEKINKFTIQKAGLYYGLRLSDNALSFWIQSQIEDFARSCHSNDCEIPRNVGNSEAESMVKYIEDALCNDTKPICRPLFPSQHLTKRVVKLQKGNKYLYSQKGSNPNDENSALLHYIQVHQDEFSMNVKLELFALIAKQATFHQLRTVEQLGYITSLSQRNDSGVYGLQFIIQSSVKGPAHIDSRVESLLKDLESKLYEMSDEEFKSNVTALIDMKLEKHKNLNEESLFYWREIQNGTLKFNRRDAEVAALRELKKEELVDFFDEYIKVGAPKKKSLSICVYGSQHLKEMASDKDKVASPFIEIQEIVGFRKSQPLYGTLKGCRQLKL